LESRYDMQEMMDFVFNSNSTANTEIGNATGTLYFENGTYTVKTRDGAVYAVDGALPANCKEGDKLAFIISGGAARVTDNFGSSAEAEPNLKALLRDYGLDTPFSADALMQAKETTFTEITAHMANRTDLRGKTIITLSETENSRNECGFSVELDGENHYILGIHTTDVAEFVDKNSALENEIFTRCKTASLPAKDIPMLPDSITKGPCFLEVGEDRLAISYFLTVDEEGKVLSFSFCESVIKTAANCLFSEIEALFLDYDTSAIMPLRKAYASVMPTIANMFNLGAALQNARVLRGGADIDKAERHFVYSRHGGRPLGVVFRKDSDPKRLVREFLSVAGQQLARYLHENNIPALYRIQSEPSAEAYDSFRRHAQLIGVDTEPYTNDRLFAGVAECIRGLREEELLLCELRKALPETDFADAPLKHFIHNTDMYTRFAYPLNRCADFATQRIVKAVIKGNPDMLMLKEKVALAISCARNESKINKCEGFAEDLIALDCLKRDRNKTYGGLVLSVDAENAKILLDNGCIAVLSLANAAKISVEEEKFVFDENSYSYGSDITVRFLDADYETATLYVGI